MGLILGGVSALDLILDGQSVSLYAGGNPPVKVWPTIRETVQITLGTGYQARDQFRAALSARGMDHQTVTEIPFEIELVGSGSAQDMFYDCRSLTHAPAMDTSSVTNMTGMFQGCSSLTHVPDMDTRQVTDMTNMFRGCAALTDGNVRLFGKNQYVNTSNMIDDSGLTREPFYDLVQITLGTGYQARDQFRAALVDRGLHYTTATDVPFGIELVGSGTVKNMFYGCASLTHVPTMYTSSSVTDTSYMFSGCTSLASVPAMDTSQVTNMANMFSGCTSLASVPAMDTSSVTNMNSVFQNCSSLTRAPVMDTSSVTNMLSMFRDCSSLTRVPDMHTHNVTNASYMFYGCAALTDGNVRLIGRHPNVGTISMISRSGLTRLPFYDTNGNPI